MVAKWTTGAARLSKIDVVISYFSAITTQLLAQISHRKQFKLCKTSHTRKKSVVAARKNLNENEPDMSQHQNVVGPFS